MEQGGETAPPEALEFFGGADAHVQLSWAVTDDLVVIGLGPEFVKHVLDTDPSTSLAENDRFSSVIDRTGKDNAGLTFVDVTAIRAVIEELPYRELTELDRYEREVKPFLEPFDVLGGSTVIGGSNPDKATFLMTVK
jgi:hypothetical protein